MREKWILTIESWLLCTDIPLKTEGEKLICTWSHGRWSVKAALFIEDAAKLQISITKGPRRKLRAEAAGIRNADGWLFFFSVRDKQQGKDEFDRSVIRISVTPDAEIRKLFSNAPFGLTYMPVMRHFLEKLKPRNVLEWGPGRSTLMLAESLPDAEIFSIEHNPQWHERIMKLAKIYASVIPIHELITLEPGKSGKYVTAPLYLDRNFDLIVIDGRMRTDCIAIARQVLNEKGVVLVHDANRIGYHQAFRFFNSAMTVNDTAVLCLGSFDLSHPKISPCTSLTIS